MANEDRRAQVVVGVDARMSAGSRATVEIIPRGGALVAALVNDAQTRWPNEHAWTAALDRGEVQRYLLALERYRAIPDDEYASAVERALEELAAIDDRADA